MSQLVRNGDRLVLAVGSTEEKTGGFDFQLLSPLLLGLLLPFIAAGYLDPAALRPWRLPICLFLVTMFVICTSLFFYTVHFPGEISAVSVDRKARSVEIVWHNMLSTTSQIIPFQEISAFRVRHSYDDDGHPTPIAELVLRSRKIIALPPGTSDDQLLPLRAAIGLG